MEFVVFAVIRTGTYLSLALGFALVFGAGRVLNLSHGTFYLLAAYLAGVVSAHTNNTAIAYGSALIGTAVLSATFYWLVLRHASGSSTRTMVLCVAVNFAVTEILRTAFGVQAVLVPQLLDGSLEVGGALVTRQAILIIPLALVLGVATAIVLQTTRFGQAVRAVAQDPEGAQLVGVSTTAVMTWMFAISGTMVALAALVLSPTTVLTPDGWVIPLIKSFAVVVLGGAGRLTGTLVASAVLGVAETSAALWLSTAAAELIGLVVIAAVLLLNPLGLTHHAT